MNHVQEGCVQINTSDEVRYGYDTGVGTARNEMSTVLYNAGMRQSTTKDCSGSIEIEERKGH